MSNGGCSGCCCSPPTSAGFAVLRGALILPSLAALPGGSIRVYRVERQASEIDLSLVHLSLSVPLPLELTAQPAMQRLARHPLCTCTRAYSVASKARKQHKPPAASSPSSPRTRPQPPSAPHVSGWTPPASASAPAPDQPAAPNTASAAAAPKRPIPVATPFAHSRHAKPRTAKSEPYREPPLVERARRKTVQERSVLESYLGAFLAASLASLA